MIQNEFDLTLLRDWINRAISAKNEAHKILATHELSTSRVIILEDLLKHLSSLPIDVQDYFEEATACLEQNFLRSSIVLSWAGFFHVFVEKLYLTQEQKLIVSRPNWKFNDLMELKENIVEFQILEVAKEIKFISKIDLRVFQGQLAERNRCAHPTFYRPSLNSALGFVDCMIRQTIQYL